MCPNKKLKWFKDHGWTTAQVTEIKKLVLKCWDESYKLSTDEEIEPAEAASNPKVHSSVSCHVYYQFMFSQVCKSKWAAETPATAAWKPDNMRSYLADPVLTFDVIKEAGGYMKYWYQASENQPKVSRMASDFCSAPGKPLSNITWAIFIVI